MPLLNQAGQFKCVVRPTDHWIGEVNNENKTLYVGLPLEVIDGACAGHHITAYMYLTEAAHDRTVETLAEVFGFDGDFEALYANEKGFEGLECSIVTAIEEYDGKPRCKVQWVNRVGGSGIRSADNDRVKNFISRFGQRSKALASNKLKDAPAPPLASKPAQDDLPF